MVEISRSLNEVVLTSTGDNADFLRYCLSDRVPFNLNMVITTEISPINYAEKLVNAKYTEIRDLFFSGLPDYGPSCEPFVRSWIFDRVLINASLLRHGAVRPHETDHVDDLMSKTGPFLLKIENTNVVDSRYSGLADYSILQNSFVDHNRALFKCNNVSLLQDVITVVSNITSPEWILYHPQWQQVALNQPRRVTAILRSFLSAAVASYLMSDADVLTMCGLWRSGLYSFMNEFVELRNDPVVDIDQINDFINKLSVYFDKRPNNVFFLLLFCGSFEHYQHVHRQLYGLHYESA